jgi:hypothetical protein
MGPRTLPVGFVLPCLPTKARSPPAGDVWLHEIKHDGFRVIARKDGAGAKLYSRPGNDLTKRFPLIVEALARLRASSCTIDGEAVACGDDGITSFDLLRHRRRDDQVFLYVFDLIELTGDDRRRDPLEQRKLDLSRLLAKAGPPSCAIRRRQAEGRGYSRGEPLQAGLSPRPSCPGHMDAWLKTGRRRRRTRTALRSQGVRIIVILVIAITARNQIPCQLCVKREG